jgi:hypothetical protein
MDNLSFLLSHKFNSDIIFSMHIYMSEPVQPKNQKKLKKCDLFKQYVIEKKKQIETLKTIEIRFD